MFALVESGSITKFFSGNQGITIGDKQYSKQIFYLWSKAEREAIGIYEVEMDTSKRKDEQWYINTNVTYAFGGGKVVLETTDYLNIDCSVADKLSGTLSIMEIT